MYQGKNGGTEHSKGNETVPEKVATTRTEDGHKQNTKTSTIIYVIQGRNMTYTHDTAAPFCIRRV